MEGWRAGGFEKWRACLQACGASEAAAAGDVECGCCCAAPSRHASSLLSSRPVSSPVLQRCSNVPCRAFERACCVCGGVG